VLIAQANQCRHLRGGISQEHRLRHGLAPGIVIAIGPAVSRFGEQRIALEQLAQFAQ
jgi:hypothetical protein